MMKAKWRRVLAMILCLCMVFSTLNGLITFAETSSEEIYYEEITSEDTSSEEITSEDTSSEEVLSEETSSEEISSEQVSSEAVSVEEAGNGTIILEYQYFPEDFSSSPVLYASAVPFSVINNNALKLKYDNNITSIKISYLVGNNWVEITGDNSADLPADPNAQYRFDFTYAISVSDLNKSGGQMVYEDLPEWFCPTGTGALMDGDTVAALIDAVDGKIVITFDPDWLGQHKDDTDLRGSFSVMGRVDWHSIPGDGKVDTLPGLNIELNFETDLAQKYGNVTIDKSEPELVEDENGLFYLKYTLTVTNAEGVAVPDITVEDTFATAGYIKEYVGITETSKSLPSNEPGDRTPWEGSSRKSFIPGQISMDGSSMFWKFDELQQGEVRTLTYYAQIADSYVSDIINNPINNRANVYSGENLKDTDAVSFAPKNSIKLEKSHQASDVKIGSDGNGEISYTIKITAGEDNTFPMKGLTLQDAFPAELSNYFAGNINEGTQITVTVDDQEKTVAYNDGSFKIDDLNLEPGEVITITYTVHVENIFFVGNDQIKLTNTATVSKGDRPLSNAQDTVTLEKQTWSRKIVGDPTDAEKDITMASSDGAFEYKNNLIVAGTNPGQFTVSKGSVKYQVVLNEGGQWDLSSTQMTDQFASNHLKYTGYLQIQLFERAENAPKGLSDQALIAELEGLAPEKTVWLNVDGKDSFSFKPEELNLPQGEYTYLLTYYAKFDNYNDIGAVKVTNSFRLEGEVGVGNGKTARLPGIEISVGKVIQGGLKYEAEKISWYYTPSPVYQTKAVGDRYSQSDFETDYTNGAIYWVIRLEGNLGTCEISGPSNRNQKLNGFYVHDTPEDSWIRRDAVVGVYLGSKGFDFTTYDSFPSFAEAQEDNTTGLEQLKGNPKNDRYFHNNSEGESYVSNAEYEWYAEDQYIDGIVFTDKFFEREFFDKGYKLPDDKAIYIVLRSSPKSLSSGAAGTAPFKTFYNKLSVASGGDPVDINTASYIYTARTSLYKESKGAYIYDKSADTFVNCSNRNNSGYIDWTPKQFVQTDMLKSSGIYAMWLLNVNWNGTMEGTYDVIDYLPEGMELVYVDVNNFGLDIKKDSAYWPKTVYISELSNNPAWTEMEQVGQDDLNNDINTITYYNSKTGEIHWRISNLTKGSEDSIKREINFRIVCRVNDPKLFLNQIETYENEAIVLDPSTQDPENPLEMEKADVTIKMPLDKYLDKETLEKLGGTVDNNGNIQGALKVNRLPFMIQINPLGLEMNKGATLPALIDELSPSISLIETSLVITTLDAQGNSVEYTNYTYDVNTTEDGQQTLIIYGLPDNTPLTIKYDTRLTVAPNVTAHVYNTAYWAGYKKPNQPQVDIPEVSYDLSGDVFANAQISIDVIKVDSLAHSKKLDGALFNLYEVETDGSLKEPAIRTGTTDSMGKVTFDNQDTKLSMMQFDTVYCLKEIKAPIGYAPIESGDYYFVIIKDADIEEIKKKYEDRNLDDLHIWYDGTKFAYEIVIENNKGAISVEKIFVDENGDEYQPTSGSYRFGLYDDDIQLEILTIQYSEGEDPKYYLGGILREKPYFTQYDPDRVLQVYELDSNGDPIKDGSIVSLNGTEYLVTYSADKIASGSDITVVNADPNQDTGSLAITKTVKNDDTDQEFIFTVTLNDSDNDPVNGTFHYSYGDSYGNVTFEGGKAEFKLKHGQTVTISGLPVGTTYKVDESDNDDYTVSVTINGSSVEPESVSGDIVKGDTDEVVFTNTKIITPDEPDAPSEDPSDPDEPDIPNVPDNPDEPDNPDIPSDDISGDAGNSGDEPGRPTDVVQNNVTDDVSKTGDSSATGLCLALMMLSGIGFMMIRFTGKRRRKK